MINVTVMGDRLSVPEGTTYGELCGKYNDKFESKIIALTSHDRAEEVI